MDAGMARRTGPAGDRHQRVGADADSREWNVARIGTLHVRESRTVAALALHVEVGRIGDLRVPGLGGIRNGIAELADGVAVVTIGRLVAGADEIGPRR